MGRLNILIITLLFCLSALVISCGSGDAGLKSQTDKALHFDLAELFLKSNAYDAASPIARKLYHQHPQDPRPPYYLGIILRERGVFEEAERYFLESIKRDAKFALAYDALGVLYGMQSRLKQSLEAHYRATEIEPDRAQLWHNLGFALTLSRSYRKAIKAYQKAITLAPNHKKIYVNIGMTYGVMGQYDEAKRMFKQALSPSEVWYHLGMIQERRGELEQARTSFDEALKLQPRFQVARDSLARVKIRIQKSQDQAKVSEPNTEDKQ